MPSPRTLITAPEVLDTFRNWVNKTELPNHDHALLFTGSDLTLSTNMILFWNVYIVDMFLYGVTDNFSFDLGII